MKFFQGPFLISLAFLAITCGYFSLANADTIDIAPMLNDLFAEWLKKQQTGDTAPDTQDVTTEASAADSAVNAGQLQTDPVSPVNAPEAVPPPPQPVQSISPFWPPFAPNPFLPPQVAPNPALPPSPYLDPAFNPYAYYPYLSPFGPFPMKIKKKKV